MRGKAPINRDNKTVAGITPACAGKRCDRGPYMAGIRDHPRVCGEKIWVHNLSYEFQGSPPRVRGKVRVHDFYIAGMRITPACAGKRLKKVLKIKGFQMRSYVISFSLMNTSCSNEASFSALWHCLPPSLKASIRSVSLYFPSELSRFLARVSVSINRGSYCPSPS